MTSNPKTQALLDTAESLFLKQGYNGTSMRDIAKAAGYKSVAGIYNHFSDKEALFNALLIARQPYETVIELAQQIDAATAEEAVRYFFTGIVALMRENIGFIQLVMIDLMEFDAIHVRGLLANMLEQISSVFGKLQTWEGIREDINPWLVIRFFGMQIFGYVITSELMPDSILNTMTDEEWQSQLIQLLLNGITGKENPA